MQRRRRSRPKVEEMAREEESELHDFGSESDWDSSEEENECEYGESSGKLFDG